MEPAVDKAAAAASGSVLLRIFVGGLSTSVTAADMEKTFSPMGRVAGVDFVRTNGRSFAYMDFEPASDRALAKLFSTYNGCIWKGGKLKLEKAKEHYLTRLKKEWEEDANANLIPTTPANPIPEKSTGLLKKLDLLKQENMQLKIYFPNLRKVKSVPFKGTGKHKYSFQRIEVPPLPIHFCDCEEHCGPYEMSCEKYQSSFDKVINEKELDVMNSVMNKLLAKEGNKTAIEETVNASNIPPEEDQGTDEDNIVTNIGMGRSNDILMHLKVRQTQSPHQETSFGKLLPSKDRYTKNKANSDKRKNSIPTIASEVAHDKRSHPGSIVKPTEDEFTPILSRKVHFQEPEIIEEAPPVKIETELKAETFESRKGNSWLQKSSWKDLVGEKNNSSFNISHLLSGSNSTAPKAVVTTDPDSSLFSAVKKRKVRFSTEETRSMPVPQNILIEKVTGLNSVEKSEEEDQIEANNEGDAEARDYVEPRTTASKKRKAKSGKEEASSQPFSPNIMSEKTASLNHVEITKEGDEIEENMKDAIGAQTYDDVEQKRTEDEPIPVSPKVVAENKTVLSKDTVPLKQGNCWQQKSPWKDLLRGNASSSFSVSSILPDINTSNSAFTISAAKDQSNEDKSNSRPYMQNIVLEKVTGLNNMEKSKEGDQIKVNNEGDVEAKDYSDVEPRTTASKKRKAKSHNKEPISLPVSAHIMLDKTTGLNHVHISQEDGIHAVEAQTCDDVEHSWTENEPIPVSPKVVADNQSVPSKDTVPLKQGNCWQQKSSWKDLLGGSASSSFSISSILPDIDTSNSAFTISAAAMNVKSQPDEDKSNSTPSTQITEKSKMKDETLESSEDPELAREDDDVVAKRIKRKVVSSKGSSFMRSEESLREWRTVKQALSGFITNKNVEKNTSKGSKGVPSWKGTQRAP